MQFLSGYILYIFLGIVGCYSLMRTKKLQTTSLRSGFLFDNYFYLAWLFLWICFVAGRVVEHHIGGEDAPNYVYFFENCLVNQNAVFSGGELWEKHMGIVYTTINKAIRLFTDNYHVFFIFIYGFIAFTYIQFLNEFSSKDICFIPIILCFFPMLLGFNTLRTTFSAAMILWALVLLYRKHTILSAILFIMSCSVHLASVVYALFFIYYQIFKNKKLSLNLVLIIAIVAYGIGKIGQNILYNSNLGFLSVTYKWYIGASYNTNIFQWQPVVVAPQVLLFICIFIFKKNIFAQMNDKSIQGSALKFIWYMCAFDLIVLPVCYIANIWRGYEYFYLARLIMWGKILQIIKSKMPRYFWYLFGYCFVFVFIAWFVFRINGNYKDASLLPYYFAPAQIY